MGEDDRLDRRPESRATSGSRGMVMPDTKRSARNGVDSLEAPSPRLASVVHRSVERSSLVEATMSSQYPIANRSPRRWAKLRERIDYGLLRVFATDRHKATEAELDAEAARSTFTVEDARAYLEKVRSVYFDGKLPVDRNLSYLDIGAGMGRLAIGLAAAGARDVTGVEIVPRHVAEAERIAEELPPDARPRFVNADIHGWTPRRRYDVIFVLGAMEHIHDPRKLLELLPHLLSPGGRAFVSHEPFEGPFGDHMSEFFRIPIPWRGMLFSEQAILRLRTEYFRPTDPATRYHEVVGGLNQMSFRTYLRYIEEAGLEVVSHSFNPQVKHYPRLRPLYPVSWLLTHLPRVQGYFIMSAYSVLARRE
jgi:2-polyprenyl-3-methyl-5-hydroxy-6-metoxy-1,4-benzoquinol methylase